MDAELIRSRRQDIEKSAPCEGCGSTLAFCESQRGKDPSAPEWFGCCAQGLDFQPCVHRASREAFRALLIEIETGQVRSVEEVMLDSMTEWSSSRPSIRNRVLSPLDASWPDDVPMGDW